MTHAEQITVDGQSLDDVRLRRDGPVATIELHRPASLNALTTTMGGELRRAVDDLADDRSVRAVIVTGAGRGFCAGADLKDRDAPLTRSGRPDLGRVLREVYNPLVIALREMAQPVIAAVNGPAVGVGCSIALACDLVLAARSAYFQLSFVNVGLVPDGGASAHVPARIGFTRAAEMLLLGERLDAASAHEWGLVNQLADDGQLADAARALAGRLAGGPPLAVAAIKRLLNAQAAPALRAQLDLEADAQTAQGESEEFAEGVAAFAQKRPPRFSPPAEA
ncbi:MAG: enoyl-CoA hydratase [Actinobacteria bacterium]|nr:MAG: enoyl-CoA hydratase [Actinomycetota bacterium]